MKKILIIALLASIFTCGAFAQDQDFTPPRDESKWSDMTYVTAPVLKVLEAKEYYAVIYQKKHTGTATVLIPKEWASFNNNEAKKLKFRDIKNPDEAYITVVKKADEFHHVILNIPMKKNNKLWGVISTDNNSEAAKKDTLEELDI